MALLNESRPTSGVVACRPHVQVDGRVVVRQQRSNGHAVNSYLNCVVVPLKNTF